MNKNLIINYSVIGVLAAAAGFGGGYILAKKKYLSVADEEIKSVRETFQRAQLVKPDLEDLVEAYKPAAEVVEEAREVIVESGYVAVGEPEYKQIGEAALIRDDPQPNQYADIQAEKIQDEFERKNELNKSIFDTHGDQTVLERTPDKPYVISASDYADDDQYTKETLIFYKDDHTLTQEDETVIQDIDTVVGELNLTYFGVFSQDPDLVHIRREKTSTDYEIVLLKASYDEMVLGNPAPNQEG